MRESTVKGHQQRLSRVVAYIESHINESLNLEQLSQIACLSPYHFHRVFRAQMGESLHEHIKRLRLEDAAFKLKYSDSSIDQISHHVGYERNTSFTKAFKQHFGQSPRNYRSSQQGRNAANACQMPTASLQTINDIDVMYVRATGSYYYAARDAWSKLGSQAGRAGAIEANTRAYGITYDSPEITAEHKIRYDACMSLPVNQQPPGGIRTQTIPGGRYAMFRHRGAYEKLEPLYDAIYQQWLPSNELQLRDLPSFCHYHQLNSTGVPEDLLVTDIYLPVE